jgi:hypothetical protein
MLAPLAFTRFRVPTLAGFGDSEVKKTIAGELALTSEKAGLSEPFPTCTEDGGEAGLETMPVVGSTTTLNKGLVLRPSVR